MYIIETRQIYTNIIVHQREYRLQEKINISKVSPVGMVRLDIIFQFDFSYDLWLGRRFSPGTPVSSTRYHSSVTLSRNMAEKVTKNDHHLFT